jgi:hypothetical protein
LPCWSDVEDDLVHSTNPRSTRAASDSVHRTAYEGAGLPMRSEPPALNAPPGFSPTPRFVGVSNMISLLPLSNVASSDQDESPSPDGASTLSLDPSARLIGTIDEISFLELVNTRLHSQMIHTQNSRNRSDSAQNISATTASSSADEWNVYHVGDGASPRDPLRPSIERVQNGEREAWIVIRTRPPNSSRDITRILFSRGVGASSTSNSNGIDVEQSNLTSTDTTHVSLRGGAGSENRHCSEEQYEPPSSRASSPRPARVRTPYPQDWLQRLSLQGDHTTTPFDVIRATRILGLRERTPYSFASTGILRSPELPSSHSSIGSSSSETFINQSLQDFTQPMHTSSLMRDQSASVRSENQSPPRPVQDIRSNFHLRPLQHRPEDSGISLFGGSVPSPNGGGILHTTSNLGDSSNRQITLILALSMPPTLPPRPNRCPEHATELSQQYPPVRVDGENDAENEEWK